MTGTTQQLAAIACRSLRAGRLPRERLAVGPRTSLLGATGLVPWKVQLTLEDCLRVVSTVDRSCEARLGSLSIDCARLAYAPEADGLPSDSLDRGPRHSRSQFTAMVAVAAPVSSIMSGCIGEAVLRHASWYCVVSAKAGLGSLSDGVVVSAYAPEAERRPFAWIRTA